MIFLNIVRNAVRPTRHAKALNAINSCVTRTYARWVGRKPIAIVNEDELFDCEDTTRSPVRREKRTSTRKSKKKKPEEEKKEETENARKKNLFMKLKENEKIVS